MFLSAILSILALWIALSEAQFTTTTKVSPTDVVYHTDANVGISGGLSPDGTVAAAGGSLDNGNIGATWTFTRNLASGQWYEANKVIGTGATQAASQGTSVCVSNDQWYTIASGGFSDEANVGSMWVFTRSGTVWAQQGSKLNGAGMVGAANFGRSVSISRNGNTLICSGLGDSSSAGATWVFTRTSGVWGQHGPKMVGTGASGAAQQGRSIFISGDGRTFVTGGWYDNSDVGSSWIFTLNSTNGWQQQGNKIQGSNTVGTALAGYSVAINYDGTTIAVGGQFDNSHIGAVWMWTLSGGTWTQQGSKLVGADHSYPSSGQGFSVALSYDGNTLVSGAIVDNNSTGGAWMFTRVGGIWSQYGSKIVGTNIINIAQQGTSIGLSENGTVMALGGPADNFSNGSMWFLDLNPALPCNRPADTASTIYSSTCLQFMSNGIGCNPVCQTGYQFTGGTGLIVCQNASIYTSGTCQPIPCTRPADTSAQTISGACASPIPSGTQCTPACNGGYTANASLTLSCNYGVLTPALGTCNPNNCAAPANTTATTYIPPCLSSMVSGTSCTPTCNSGYYLPSGNLLMTCMAGNFTTPTGTCTAITCNRPGNTPSTDYSDNCPVLINYNQVCTPTCETGYTASASLDITCISPATFSSPQGTCTPNPCPRPADTASTIYSQASCPAPTSSGSQCTPTCFTGYSSTGSLAMTCTLGVFSTPVGVCAPNNCASPTSTSSTDYSSCAGGVTSGSTCTPVCMSGYTASADLSIQCFAGSFSSPQGVCNPSPCSPPTVSNPYAPGSCTTVIASGTACVLGCVSGYISNGSLSTTCDHGNYDSATGYCEFDTSQTLCSQPTPPYPKTPGNCPTQGTEGVTCELGCVTGFAPSSASEFIAECHNRTFVYNASTSTFAVCLPDPCSPPTLAITGMIAAGCASTIENNASCTLGCDTGYTAAGTMSITCTNGQFSPILGSCSPNACHQLTILPNSHEQVGTCSGFTDSGSGCTLSCASGFTGFGDFSLTCTTGTFAYNGIGFCIAVATVSTTATSLATPPLVAAPGTVLSITIIATSGSDGYLSGLSFTASPAGVPTTINAAAVNVSTTSSLILVPDLSSLAPAGSGNVTVTLGGFVTIPSLGINSSPLVSFSPQMIFVPVPVLSNACPDTIRIQVYQTVVVRGSGFYAGSSVRCFLDGAPQLSIPSDVDSQSVTCKLLYPGDDVGGTVNLYVGNDGVMPVGQTGVPITLIGACQSEKPGSIAGDDGCTCPAGTRDDGVSCVLCDNGFYQPQAGQGECLPCGNDQDTDFILGSISPVACVCRASTYLNPSTQTCLPCANGMICPGNNTIYIKPGYWRANDRSVSVLACPDGTASCSGTSNSSSTQCNLGYHGPLCSICNKDYAPLGEACVRCPPSGLNGFVLLLLVLLAIFLAALLIHTSSSFTNEEYRSSSEKLEKMKIPTLGVIVKVTLNYLQVLYYIGRLSANWTGMAITFFAVIGQSTLTPNFPSVTCAARWTFYQRLIFIYISPIIVTVVLATIYVVRHVMKRLTVNQTKADSQYAIMLILYQIHPTIMLEVISSLPCQPIPGTGTSYLKADMSVDCSQPAYASYAAVSSVYLVVYILGMIVLVTYRGLYHNYKNGKLFVPSSSANFKYSFFFTGYRRNAYYWEAVVMMRKLIIVALSVLASAGLQLVWAGVVVGGALLMNNNMEPYASPFINHLENLSLGALYATVILGFHFLLTNTEHIWSTVLLVIINGGVTLILFACCLSKLRSHLKKLDRFLPEGWKKDTQGSFTMRTKKSTQGSISSTVVEQTAEMTMI